MEVFVWTGPILFELRRESSPSSYTQLQSFLLYIADLIKSQKRQLKVFNQIYFMEEFLG